MFRGRDAATVTAMYHAACDMLEGCCPRAAAVLEEAEPDALAYLGFPPTQWKCLRTNNVQEGTNRENKAQVALRADVPLHGFTGAYGRRGHVRAGQDVAEVKVLLGGKDGRALGRGPHARNRRDGRLGAAGSGGQEDNRIGPQACGQDRDDIGYQPYSRFQDDGPARFGSCATPTFSTLPISAVWPTEKPKSRGRLD